VARLHSRIEVLDIILVIDWRYTVLAIGEHHARAALSMAGPSARHLTRGHQPLVPDPAATMNARCSGFPVATRRTGHEATSRTRWPSR
jgi:hypothetical protein